MHSNYPRKNVAGLLLLHKLVCSALAQEALHSTPLCRANSQGPLGIRPSGYSGGVVTSIHIQGASRGQTGVHTPSQRDYKTCGGQEPSRDRTKVHVQARGLLEVDVKKQSEAKLGF